MKISKLFHWLYAILMFLPVFFIGGRTLYTIFNKNAFESYSGGVNTSISSYDDFVSSKEYNISSKPYQTFDNVAGINTYNISYFYDNLNNLSLNFTPTKFLMFVDSDNYINFQFRDNNSNVRQVISSSFPINFNFYLVSTEINSSNDSFLPLFTLVASSDTQYLDNAFTYSVNEINSNPLFSWASTSFLVAPMSYIGNLFGLSATSPIITMLSYWLSISIIWLVFDLVMYVPLLVHRWIDKGIIE